MDAMTGALELVRNNLNAALQAAEPRRGDWIILANSPRDEGPLPDAARGQIVMTVIDIAQSATAPHAGSGVALVQLDLLIAFTAHFANEDYAKALAALARTVGFFHRTPVFTPAGGEPLTMQKENLPLADASRIMVAMSVRHLPCVFYRLRGVAL